MEMNVKGISKAVHQCNTVCAVERSCRSGVGFYRTVVRLEIVYAAGGSGGRSPPDVRKG